MRAALATANWTAKGPRDGFGHAALKANALGPPVVTVTGPKIVGAPVAAVASSRYQYVLSASTPASSATSSPATSRTGAATRPHGPIAAGERCSSTLAMSDGSDSAHDTRTPESVGSASSRVTSVGVG